MDTSKLKTIPQETKDSALQEQPFPDEETGLCQWTLASGKRKGEVCENKTFDGCIYCHRHKALSAAKDAPPDSPKLKPKPPPQDTKLLEIIPPSALVPSTNPAPLQHQRPPPLPKPQLPSTLTMPDVLAILNIFSQTAIGVAGALKKDSPS